MSVPIAWPPVRTAFRSVFVNVTTSGQMSTHGAHANAPPSRESAGSASNILHHRAVTHLESRDQITGVCLRSCCPRDAPRLISPHLEGRFTSLSPFLGGAMRIALSAISTEFTVHLGRPRGESLAASLRFRGRKPTTKHKPEQPAREGKSNPKENCISHSEALLALFLSTPPRDSLCLTCGPRTYNKAISSTSSNHARALQETPSLSP